MSKRADLEADRADACAELHKLLSPGDTVWTILRHVSSSGMFRVIDLAIPIMKERRFNVYSPTLALLREALPDRATKALIPGPEVYVIPPAGESSRDRDDTGRADLLSIDRTQGRVRFNYGRNAGKEMDMPRARLMVVETREAPAIRSIGWLAARAMGDSFDRDRQGIKAGGCGMDMGFNLVYNLGATMWPKGTPKPHGSRNGESDTAGGYALNHSWL